MVLPSLALAPGHVTDSVRLGRKSSMTAQQLLANYAIWGRFARRARLYLWVLFRLGEVCQHVSKWALFWISSVLTWPGQPVHFWVH